jgi:2,3,4,5-tetrahydropyridine-2-carboxylate N-succinyltransferase
MTDTGDRQLQTLIEDAWERRGELAPARVPAELREAVERCLDGLEWGRYRVAEPLGEPGQWRVNQWLKKAVLLAFRVHGNEVIEAGYTKFFDKLPLRWARNHGASVETSGARVVPPPCAGAHRCDAVLMPATSTSGRVGEAPWSTPGRRSDPARRSAATCTCPVALESAAFWNRCRQRQRSSRTTFTARDRKWSRAFVERGSVLSMGVYIGQSTRIYHRESGEILRGRVPAGSVVVPGALPAADGSHSLYCAVIVKQVDERTRARTSVNEILRNAE